jgi:transposase InsO family protein
MGLRRGTQPRIVAISSSRFEFAAAAAAADRGQSRLGVRLRLRYLRGWSHAEVPHGIDEFTRECLAIDVAGGIRSGRVIEVLAQLVSVHGTARYLRSDNGPEFVARAILRWLQTAQIETAFIDPGKPWQNGADESFNGKFRDQHLSLQWFRNRADAKASIEA